MYTTTTTTTIRASTTPQPGEVLADFTVKGMKPTPFAWAPGGYRNGREAAAGRENVELQAWRAAIRRAAREGRDPKVFVGPVDLNFTFYMVTPAGGSDGDWWLIPPRYDTAKGRLAYASHRNHADATNCQKSAEDALRGLFFDDDTQVCRVTSEKRYGPFQGVRIIIRAADSTRLN